MDKIENSPEGTKIELIQSDGRDFFSISYASEETMETPFGTWPKRSFSAGNHDYLLAVETFCKTLESNGYNFETKIWQ